MKFWRGILALVALSYFFAIFTFGLTMSSLAKFATEGSQYTLVNLLDPNSTHYKAILAFMLLQGWMSLCLFANRLRDTGASGWFALALLIPLIGFTGLLLYCGFVAGSAIGTPAKASTGNWRIDLNAPEDDNSADIDAMIARAKAAKVAALVRQPQMDLPRPAGPVVFGKRRQAG